MRHQLDLSSHTEMWERIKFTKENNLALQLRTSRLRRYSTQWLCASIMFSCLQQDNNVFCVKNSTPKAIIFNANTWS